MPIVQQRPDLVSTVAHVAGAVAGLVLAVIVVLNLHILVGLEQGYAASPSEVLDRSTVLAVVDVVVLVLGAVGGVALVRRARRRA